MPPEVFSRIAKAPSYKKRLYAGLLRIIVSVFAVIVVRAVVDPLGRKIAALWKRICDGVGWEMNKSPTRKLVIVPVTLQVTWR